MKNLNKFSKRFGQLLLVILISFFSGLLGGLIVFQFNQKHVNGTQNTITTTQTYSKNENATTQARSKMRLYLLLPIQVIRKIDLTELKILIQIQILNRLIVKVPVLSIRKKVNLPT